MTDNQNQSAVQASINVPEGVQNYAAKEVKFNFRKDKELGTKRPSVTLQVKTLTLQGLVAILEGGDDKQVSLILETLQLPIMEQARAQVDENEAITQETLDESKLTWEAISKLEPAARRGGGVPKETWEAFVADYIEIMPGITGKTKEQVSRAASILGAKWSSVKTAKPIIKLLSDQLDIWFSNTARSEEFVDCYEFLKNKAEALLAASEESLLANL